MTTSMEDFRVFGGNSNLRMVCTTLPVKEAQTRLCQQDPGLWHSVIGPDLQGLPMPCKCHSFEGRYHYLFKR